MRTVTRISPITRQEVGKLRVAAYCRVSSNSADQLNSYANQIRFYTAMIQKRQEWEMVEIFADEGLTGTKADTRPEFQRMIQMCELHQIDLIIVKSVSRFARNTKEALEYCRQLKLLGVGVQFEKEGINTLSLGDEMLLNTFAAIAQEESVAISQNVRLSNSKRMADGTFVCNNAPYGYRLVDKVLVEYPPEANVVRRIFTDYLNGKSATAIACQLNEEQIPTKNGHAKWKSYTITYILGNERYVGDSLFQKSCRTATFPFKKQRNRGQEDQYAASNTHAGIIDRDSFDAVQKLLHKRQDSFSRNTGFNQYILTSRIHCAECGSPYYKRNHKSGIRWGCSKHINNPESCQSYYYAEERITDGIIAIINKLRFGQECILDEVIRRLMAVVAIHKKNNDTAYQLSAQIAELNAKLLTLEQLRSKGYLAEDVYQSQVMEVNHQLRQFKDERVSTLDSHLDTMLHEISKLKTLIDELDEPLEHMDDKLFQEIVAGISINNRDEMTVTLLGGLKFTEVI